LRTTWSSIPAHRCELHPHPFASNPIPHLQFLLNDASSEERSAGFKTCAANGSLLGPTGSNGILKRVSTLVEKRPSIPVCKSH
jgi:hypothetical protein